MQTRLVPQFKVAFHRVGFSSLCGRVINYATSESANSKILDRRCKMDERAALRVIQLSLLLDFFLIAC